MKTTKSDIFSRLKDILSCNLEEIEGITPESELDQLGIHSIVSVKITIEIEMEFDFEFNNEDLDFVKFSTVNDLIEYIYEKT